jgi:hypothetical protein
MNVPLAGGGTREERIQVVEQKLESIKGRIEGAILSPDTAGGTMDVAHTASIVVDGKTEGGGTNPMRGTWKLTRRKYLKSARRSIMIK